MKRVLKIIGFSVLGSIVFFIIVGILINIFVPKEELEETSRRAEIRKQERIEARKQAEREKVEREKQAEELAKETQRLQKAAAEEKKAAEKAAKEAERKRKREVEEKARIESLKKEVSSWVTPYVLIKDYNTNPFVAEAKYKGKVVHLTGILRGFNSNKELLLASGNMAETITCDVWSGPIGSLRKGQKIQLIGRVDSGTKAGNIKLWNCHILSLSQSE